MVKEDVAMSENKKGVGPLSTGLCLHKGFTFRYKSMDVQNTLEEGQ